MREKVEELEEMMQELDPVILPLKHHFADGIYAREMFLPAGALITGAVHKTKHMCILSQGRVRVATDDGPVELVAPATLIAYPGAKRAIYALEDSVWTNIHATTETDLDKLVEELTESTAAELQGGAANKQQLAHAERELTWLLSQQP
jgi:quercetin dioxygenase-like cupin family protein